MKVYVLKIEEIDTDSKNYREVEIKPLMAIVEECMEAVTIDTRSIESKEFMLKQIRNFVGREVNVFIERDNLPLINDIFRFKEYFDIKTNQFRYY